MAGLVQVKGGFSVSIRSGSVKGPTGSKRGLQFRLKIIVPESYGAPQARKALAVSALADITAMRDALVHVGRGAQAEYLMRRAGAVADDPEKFAFAIASANVVMVRPSEKASEASSMFVTWGQLARAWCSGELARLYPNAGYSKKTSEDTDEPRVKFLCKYIDSVPLATFNDDDYWRAMRPAREHCKTDATFKAYAQVCRRVLKIAVELKVIPAWPLGPLCKLPVLTKGSAPVFPFLYPDEYVRLMRCEAIRFEYRVLWGFIIREGLRISEAHRIRWEHLSRLPNGRWLLDVPDTKTGRALNFILNLGTGEVLEALRERMPELGGPFAWLKTTNIKKAAEDLRRHVELSGTTRERLLYTDGRLRRLREHDLRSTFVTWCKLAGVDNETISQHTGHESSKMIATYNRSKATIEHLGLAPYLPLAQAFGEGALLGAGAAPGPRLLGMGAAEVEVLSADMDSAPEVCCPDCSRPMGRLVSAEGRGGWSCPSCNAAGDAEGDWLDVTGELEAQPDGAAATGAELGNHSPGADALDQPIAPVSRDKRPATPSTTLLPGDPAEPCALSRPEGGARGDSMSRDHMIPVGSPRRPLNGWHGCDAARDGGSGAQCRPMPQGENESRIDALCAREGSNLHTRGYRNLNPRPDDRNQQNPLPSPDRPVPEATGTDGSSHPGVTLLGQLEASHRAAAADRNWAALRALEQLIDGEVARLAEAAGAAPPAPVRLEVVRAAKRDRGGQ